MESAIKFLKQEEVATGKPWIVPRRIDMRIIYLLAVISPWIGFALFGLDRFGAAEWQDGQWSTYLALSFAETVWVWFAPLLIYSSVSMLLLLWDADRFAQAWFVRFGIYTGSILAVQFSIQTMLSRDLSAGFFIGVLCVIPLFGLNWFVGWLIRLIQQKRHHENFWKVTGGILAFVGLIWLGLFFIGYGGGPIGFLIVGLPTAGVVLAPVFAVLTSYRLFQIVEREQVGNFVIKAFSWAAWVTGYGAAGTVAIMRVFDLYSQLPTEPPHCYIATASGKGHAGLVRPMPVKMANGGTLLVTRQLQILKAGELVLRELTPDLHKNMRRVYDWIGPKMAQRIRGPWSADLGYLLFKPFELATLILLRWLLPAEMEKVKRFYTGS